MARTAKITIIRFAAEKTTDSDDEDEVYCFRQQGAGQIDPVVTQKYQLGNWADGANRPMGTVIFDGPTEPTAGSTLRPVPIYLEFWDGDDTSGDDYLGGMDLLYDADGAARFRNNRDTDCFGHEQGPDSVQFRMSGSGARFYVWLKVETNPVVEVRFPAPPG